MSRGLKHITHSRVRWFAFVLISLLPITAEAASLSALNLALGTSASSVSTSHAFSLTTATSANIGSIGFTYCTTSNGGCTMPAGLVTTSATLTAQGGATGFSIVNTTNGSPYITRTAANIPASTVLTYTLSGVVNPSTTNTSFYVRITTYTGTDGVTGPIDTGSATASTATQVQLTGVTPPILIFCVATSITSDCTSATGNSVNFGDFSPQSTNGATSLMQASTNAANGYTVTVNGTTLASGANTIPGLASQTAPSVGTSQFGLNIRANASPAIGADPSGPGIGTYSPNYGLANLYRFVSGDTVAQASGPSDANTFTSSYMVNIRGSQAAGVYVTTLTYICTANF